MKVIEGIGVNGEMELNKKKKNIIGITQSGLILVLVVLIVFMMVQINRLQGTARVINYAGDVYKRQVFAVRTHPHRVSKRGKRHEPGCSSRHGRNRAILLKRIVTPGSRQKLADFFRTSA